MVWFPPIPKYCIIFLSFIIFPVLVYKFIIWLCLYCHSKQMRFCDAIILTVWFRMLIESLFGFKNETILLELRMKQCLTINDNDNLWSPLQLLKQKHFHTLTIWMKYEDKMSKKAKLLLDQIKGEKVFCFFYVYCGVTHAQALF